MLKDHLDDILFLLGAILVTTGVALMSIPAACITAGAFCLVGAAIYGRYLGVIAKAGSGESDAQ